ncbi:MAG TPA: hypothetical protein VF627_13930, partial [Abditibacterium sp.]
LTQLHATFELRFGAWSPLERALQITSEVALRARPELAAYLRAKTGLPVNEDIQGEDFSGLPASTPWEILNASAAHIAADFQAFQARHENCRDAALMTGAHLIGPTSNVFIGRGAVVQPGCVLDASGGPIILDEGVVVKWSQIQGPVFVGKNTVLDGARIRAGSSIGAHCKVGGEVSASIFQSRVNKAHDGFVGNSWAGRWVNFGALATTSNLKNTYGTIRFQRDFATSIETGSQFLGSLIGDHTKIGIGQMLTTGANLGAACNIFGGGVSPKYVPSFSWGGQGGWSEHRLEDALKTARATMGRRSLVLRDESEAALRRLFPATQKERDQFLATDKHG